MSYKPATEAALNIELSLDQRQALQSDSSTAAHRVRRHRQGGTHRPVRVLLLRQFADRATVHDFLALLAERFARQRLRALAKVQGKAADAKPVVLFLCNHNAGRSQMAMGFFTHLTEDAAVVWSGGSEPQGEINPAVIAVMAERGIHISGEYPKTWTDEVIQAADVIITMSCDTCPRLPGRRYEDWDLDDPDGKEVAEVRPIRDEIEVTCAAYFTKCGSPAGPDPHTPLPPSVGVGVESLWAWLRAPAESRRRSTTPHNTSRDNRVSGRRTAGFDGRCRRPVIAKRPMSFVKCLGPSTRGTGDESLRIQSPHRVGIRPTQHRHHPLGDVLGDQAYESLVRKGEAMTSATMAYAYDQIDQARTELNAISK
jgi:arsenate reductase (thioredoxin)